MFLNLIILKCVYILLIVDMNPFHHKKNRITVTPRSYPLVTYFTNNKYSRPLFGEISYLCFCNSRITPMSINHKWQTPFSSWNQKSGKRDRISISDTTPLFRNPDLQFSFVNTDYSDILISKLHVLFCMWSCP